MTTQSDNTLEGILKKFAIDTHEVRPGQDKTLNFDNAKAALAKWRDDAVRTAQLDLLTRLEAEQFWAADDQYDAGQVVSLETLQAERAKLKEVK